MLLRFEFSLSGLSTINMIGQNVVLYLLDSNEG